MSRYPFAAVLGLALAVALIAIPVVAQTRSADPVQLAFDELIATDRAFAKAGAGLPMTAGIAAAFADDVIMPVRGRSFARGRNAAIAAFEEKPEDRGSRADWMPLGGGLSADALHGFTFGTLRLWRQDGQMLPFKYLAYWVRGAAGWRIAAYKRARGADGEPAQSLLRFLPTVLVAPSDDRELHRRNAASLERAERAFSDEAQRIGLGPAFAKHGSAQAINLGGPAQAGVIVGAANIARHVDGSEPAVGSVLSWSADEVIVAGSGDLGVSIGHIRHNTRAADGSERPAIPFFTIWQRASVRDAWRYVAE